MEVVARVCRWRTPDSAKDFVRIQPHAKAGRIARLCHLQCPALRKRATSRTVSSATPRLHVSRTTSCFSFRWLRRFLYGVAEEGRRSNVKRVVNDNLFPKVGAVFNKCLVNWMCLVYIMASHII